MKSLGTALLCMHVAAQTGVLHPLSGMTVGDVILVGVAALRVPSFMNHEQLEA